MDRDSSWSRPRKLSSLITWIGLLEMSNLFSLFSWLQRLLGTTLSRLLETSKSSSWVMFVKEIELGAEMRFEDRFSVTNSAKFNIGIERKPHPDIERCLRQWDNPSNNVSDKTRIGLKDKSKCCSWGNLWPKKDSGRDLIWLWLTSKYKRWGKEMKEEECLLVVSSASRESSVHLLSWVSFRPLESLSSSKFNERIWLKDKSRILRVLVTGIRVLWGK